MLPLGNDFVKSPKDEIPSRLLQTEQDWNKLHEFHNVRGAIDRTHIPASLPPEDKAPYRDRKGAISQNILAGCTFDMLFFYVLPGWEGSAHDARVLKFALEQDSSFPPPSETWVYLADAGYGLKPGILVPYEKVRYHLREQVLAARQPETKQELFNLRRAQLRNVIEGIFGVLKKRFRILDTLNILLIFNPNLYLCSVHYTISSRFCLVARKISFMLRQIRSFRYKAYPVSLLQVEHKTIWCQKPLKVLGEAISTSIILVEWHLDHTFCLISSGKRKRCLPTAISRVGIALVPFQNHLHYLIMSSPRGQRE